MATVSSLEIENQQLRFWVVRGGVSVADQGLTSGASFVMNLMLARWLTGEAYGAFAVAFATLLFFASYHTVLLLEPMTVVGPASYPGRILEYFLAQLKIHVLLVTILSGLLLVASTIMTALRVERELVMATVGSAVAVPFLLLLWLVRRMSYVVQRPAVAAWASAGYFVVIVAGLFVMHSKGWLSPFSAYLWMGAASIVAVIVPIYQLDLTNIPLGEACRLRPVLRENWKYGRWLVASTTLQSVASQTQIYLAAAMLGLDAAGILRATQIPSLVMTQVVTAVALLVLPAMSYEFGLRRFDLLRRKAVLSTVIPTAMAVVYAMALWIFAKPTERLLFGGKFAAYAWLIPVMGLIPVCTGLALGFAMALRALQKPHFDLLANAISAPVGLITAIVFIKLWGVSGAAISLVAGYAANSAVLLLCAGKLTREARSVPLVPRELEPL
jgi:O-antigen/teichoic acid export membrane protein